jgi:hypothetical protein
MVTPKNSHPLQKALLLSVSTIAALAAQLLVALPAKAECVYEGRVYQTGETVGPYVCMPDGTWQPQ